MLWSIGFIAFFVCDIIARISMHYRKHDNYFGALVGAALFLCIPAIVISEIYLRSIKGLN